MYIESIKINHLKLLKDFRLEFQEEDGSLRSWTVIIGKNGTAKTSILQAIALAAAGKLQINTLAKDIVGHLRDRRSQGTLRINAEFSFPEPTRAQSFHPTLRRDIEAEERLRSQVELRARMTSLEADANYVHGEEPVTTTRDPLVDARARNLERWFVASYGVSRFLPDPSRSPKLEIPSIERMESLFQQTFGLTSLRFIDHFEDEQARRFVVLLRDTLTRVEALVPDLEGIELRGKGGVRTAGQLIDRDRFQLRIGNRKYKLPAVALSHGYQSVIAWIADLIGHMVDVERYWWKTWDWDNQLFACHTCNGRGGQGQLLPARVR